MEHIRSNARGREMSDLYKFSGKRVKIPAPPKGWRFEPRPGGWVVAISPAGKRIRFSMHELRGKLSLSLSGSLYFGEVAQESRVHSGAAGGGDSDLIAQFPGKVRKLLVAAGAKIAAGDSLILVEAMKMEFTVKAPFAGTVQRVLVQEGQQLSPGDRFFDIVASENRQNEDRGEEKIGG